MSSVLADWSFRISLGVCAILSWGLAFAATLPYKVAKENKKSVSADRLTSSANAVITVAGFTIPLVAALTAYAVLQLDQSASDLAYLLAALVAMTVSVLTGVYAITSMAALGDAQGQIDIHKDDNRGLIFHLASQVLWFIASMVLVATYIFVGVKFENRSPSAGQDLQGQPAILRRAISVGEPAESLASTWGAAESTTSADGTVTQTYRTQHSTFEIKVQAGKVTQVKETAN